MLKQGKEGAAGADASAYAGEAAEAADVAEARLAQPKGDSPYRSESGSRYGHYVLGTLYDGNVAERTLSLWQQAADQGLDAELSWRWATVET